MTERSRPTAGQLTACSHELPLEAVGALWPDHALARQLAARLDATCSVQDLDRRASWAVTGRMTRVGRPLSFRELAGAAHQGSHAVALDLSDCRALEDLASCWLRPEWQSRVVAPSDLPVVEHGYDVSDLLAATGSAGVVSLPEDLETLAELKVQGTGAVLQGRLLGALSWCCGHRDEVARVVRACVVKTLVAGGDIEDLAAAGDIDSMISEVVGDARRAGGALCAQISELAGVAGVSDTTIGSLHEVVRLESQGEANVVARLVRRAICRDLPVSSSGPTAALPDDLVSPAGAGVVVVAAIDNDRDPHLPPSSRVRVAFRDIFGRAPRVAEERLLAEVRNRITNEGGWPKVSESTYDRCFKAHCLELDDGTELVVTGSEVPVVGLNRRWDYAVEVTLPDGSEFSAIVEIDGEHHTQDTVVFTASLEEVQAADIEKVVAHFRHQDEHEQVVVPIVVLDYTCLSSDRVATELRRELGSALCNVLEHDCDMLLVGSGDKPSREVPEGLFWHYHRTGELYFTYGYTSEDRLERVRQQISIGAS